MDRGIADLAGKSRLSLGPLYQLRARTDHNAINRKEYLLQALRRV